MFNSNELSHIDQLVIIVKLLPATRQRVQLELIHDQLPLAVPCYDLVPVT